MNPDSYSITYLTGAGMMVDLAAWILIALGMLATSFSIGLILAVARKRRIAKIQDRRDEQFNSDLRSMEHW